jgi:protein-L-isoaspartate(D-aspartate) O-methyltransferase
MQPTLDAERARFNMIEQQVRPWDVLDDNVLKLLAAVKREDFVATSQEQLAFADVNLPILVDGVDSGELLLAPKIEARLLQALSIGPGDSVLEIGTGSGHFAALLGARARSVVSLEINPAIAAQARTALDRAGIRNVQVVQADGACGFIASQVAGTAAADIQPDVIVLSGSTPAIPPTYVDMLKPGGRLIAFIGSVPLSQVELVTREHDGSLRQRTLFETMVPPLRNAAQPSKFKF